jgi:hypothetical protein
MNKTPSRTKSPVVIACSEPEQQTFSTINANIDLSEIVNVFVSRYEEKLHARKAEIQATIKHSKCHLKQNESELLEEAAEYFNQMYGVDRVAHAAPTLQLEASMSRCNLLIDSNGQISVTIVINICSKAKTNVYNNSIQLTKSIDKDSGNFKIKNLIICVENIHEQINGYVSDLKGVMADINDVSRKERQVRAKFSELKIKESGLDVLSNPELLALIDSEI